jgi:hypothetical protein
LLIFSKMNDGRFVFSQLMGLISYKKFQTLVNRHNGDFKVKDFPCWKQYLRMAFGQLTHRESISDTILCLKANRNKLYHLGMEKVVAISTLTRTNEIRSFQIYQDLAISLITEAKQLYLFDNDLNAFSNFNVFAIDSTRTGK